MIVETVLYAHFGSGNFSITPFTEVSCKSHKTCIICSSDFVNCLLKNSTNYLVQYDKYN
jgi:hypothetical protein